MTRYARPLFAAMLGIAAALGAQPLPAGPEPMRSSGGETRSKTYGTDVYSSYVIDASELSPIDSITEYRSSTGSRRWILSNSTLGLLARPHLPPGAKIHSLELDYYDASSTGAVYADLWSCDVFGDVCLVLPGQCENDLVTVCSGIASAQGDGEVVVSFNDSELVIDDFQRRILIFAGNSTHDGSTAISRIVITYALQVSPEPPFATYSDVPLEHPFSQFIEALAKSGITGGCGGGKYCPDAPLTRGQMAVFLAKALGLQFH